MRTFQTFLVALLISGTFCIASCNPSGGDSADSKGIDSTAASPSVAGMTVTPENFIRAETDRMFYDISLLPGSSINNFYHFQNVTPLEQQTVVRMNRDVLYSGAVVDVSKGATVTFPEMPKGRYASILLIDNDHYCPKVIYTPGKHQLPQDTRYLALAMRIQVFNSKDTAELALVRDLQKRFVIESNSAEPFPKPEWDKASLDSLRGAYEAEFVKFDKYPDDWMGPRGSLNEETRRLAAAGAWGLFPNRDAIYINYKPENASPDKCYVATYKVPDVGAFWSITVYGKDGYIKSENSVVNRSNVKFNKDGTFTVHFGPADKCKGALNRVEVSEGWNFLMRCYKPGKSVLDGTYKLPEVSEEK